MAKRVLIFVLLLAPWLGGGSCAAERYRVAKPMGATVDLGPFPKPAAGSAGFNLYMAEKAEGPFEKINDIPLGGGAKLLVPNLDAGRDYFFRMTSVSQKDTGKESAPGQVFKRTAAVKKTN